MSDNALTFDDLKQLTDPRLHFRGSIRELPVECFPKWTREMGHRLMNWRTSKCVRFNRFNGRHEGLVYLHACQCLSQVELAKRLQISQSKLSKLENGAPKIDPPNVARLLIGFSGDYGALLYVLTGKFAERYAPTPKRKRTELDEYTGRIS